VKQVSGKVRIEDTCFAMCREVFVAHHHETKNHESHRNSAEEVELEMGKA
jgi:hypothetical protein